MQKLLYERPVVQRLNAGTMNKFGTRTEYLPVTHIENMSVAELMNAHGSPLFVLSENKMRQLHAQVRRAFETRYPKVQFAWSYKTNYIGAVCNVQHQLGSWAEVVSGFEYQKALQLGVPGNRIIFNGPDKTDDEIAAAITNDSLLHIDHLDEMYRVMELSTLQNKRPKVAIRVNMDTGIYPVWDRFGFNYENGQAWDAVNKIILTDKMDLIGLHAHIGTFMLSASAYGVAAKKLTDLAYSIKQKFNRRIDYLDLGGGFASRNTLKGTYLNGSDAVPAFDDYAEAISTALLNSDYCKEHLPLLILETGRALVDEAGYLLGTVLANKRLADGRRATILDFGVNILFTSFWYDHKISPAQEFSHYTEDTVLYGPLCMNIDVVREHITLPPLRKGDRLVVHNVGAYNMTQWMQFISLRPNVVMIDTAGKAHVIRERETLAYLTQPERTPSHLSTFTL